MRSRSNFAISSERTVVIAFVIRLAVVAVMTAAAWQPATAQVDDRINTAFRNWLGLNKIANASLVVMKDGALIGHFGHNDRGTDTTVPVASLSKAITGACIASLIDGGRLGFQDVIVRPAATPAGQSTL